VWKWGTKSGKKKKRERERLEKHSIFQMVIVLNCGCGYALIFDTKCGHNCSYNVFAPACYRGCHSEAILCVAVANQIAF